GDRGRGESLAKEQLLADVDDTNPVAEVAAVEADIMAVANKLDIGPMGFGGKLTLGCCKVGARNRLPASFFLSVAYMCWAYRRRGVLLTPAGEVVDWLYQAPGEFDGEAGRAPGEPGRGSAGSADLVQLGALGAQAGRPQTP